MLLLYITFLDCRLNTRNKSNSYRISKTILDTTHSEYYQKKSRLLRKKTGQNGLIEITTN